jgi:DNA-directed RNA polymerase specialized sigma24 family protein
MLQTASDDRGGGTSRDDRPDPATEAFLTHRNLLFTVAYEMLGLAADAADVLQETCVTGSSGAKSPFPCRAPSGPDNRGGSQERLAT